MLPRALLLIGGDDGFIGIVVTNFPVLPAGSNIALYLPEGPSIENAKILSYEIESNRGVTIDLGLDEKLGEAEWKALASVCIEDPSTVVELVYPHIVDFGAEMFRLPSEKKS